MNYPFFNNIGSGLCTVDRIESPCYMFGLDAVTRPGVNQPVSKPKPAKPVNPTPGLNEFAGPTMTQTYGNRRFATNGTGVIEFSPTPNQFASPFVRAQGAPQNPVPLGDLATNVAKKLTGDCGKFVKDLYKTVAGKFPQQKAWSKDFNLLDVFNTMNSRVGGVVLKPGLTVNGKPADGTVSGAIGNPDYPATIMIKPNYGGSPYAFRWAQEEGYVMTAIHETFHLAGTNGGYDDKEMAQAVFDLTGMPGLPKSGSTIEDYSRYWNAVLEDRCRLRE